ncbi:ABC transporter permease [Falsihalocynthiibacter arcticus]|uniref:ABC transporter permease n=1 Tax=Falsihalocynthiibacter arcticus TaxID=1579316 RepID=A0A126UXW8_9RHOB|nr:ABC transporter permease [Falsihalocynthiibacter arcticus]AML50911.1 ABC transporter permease [Falsihalocynthiibacter arcticus]
MFQVQPQKHKGLHTALAILELIYHSTVREVRKSHGNALIGLLLNMMQTVVLVVAFYVMFSVLGLRGSAIRGDFLLYIMSGIFLFMTHTKAMGAVVGAPGPTSAMMLHAPMNTVVAICSSALAALYIQILSVSVVLFLYHTAITPITINQPAGAFAMLLLAWATGVSIGMVFLAAKPWAPGFIGLAATIYARANMIASGKMFLAKTLPGWMLSLFDWNPLFHVIDQCRGFVFINYIATVSSISYPVKVTIALTMIGLMGEFYTRKHASISWSAGR